MCSHNILFLLHHLYHTIYMIMVCLLISSLYQTVCSLSKGAVLPFFLEEKDYMTLCLHC